MSDTEYCECPFCKEDVKLEAIKCKHCKSSLNGGESLEVNGANSENQQLSQITANDSNTEKHYKDRSKASLTMGIIGLFLFLLPLFTFVLSGIGLIFGIKSRKRTKSKIALAGVIVCSIGLLLNLAIWIPLSVPLYSDLRYHLLPAIASRTNDLYSVAESNFASVYGDGAVYSGSSESVVVIIDNNAKPATTRALKQMLNDLGFSSAVADRMYQTRALDGTQSAEGIRATATWTFHPNSGLRIVFERR